jgi:hypothetical protein
VSAWTRARPRRNDVEWGVPGLVEAEPERGDRALVLEPRAIERGAGPEQRQLALQQVVFADAAHVEAALVQAVEGVVHRDVGRGVVEPHLRLVHIEEEVHGADRDLLPCLAKARSVTS